jgi:inhibitor of KinA sporulation pathway (predicted exonuclease)
MKYLILISLSIACASTPNYELSKEAKELEVFVNKPQNCNVVGKVVGQNGQGSKELAVNDALNQAAKLKATGLHVNQEVPNGNLMTVYATAYKCE